MRQSIVSAPTVSSTPTSEPHAPTNVQGAFLSMFRSELCIAATLAMLVPVGVAVLIALL